MLVLPGHWQQPTSCNHQHSRREAYRPSIPQLRPSPAGRTCCKPELIGPRTVCRAKDSGGMNFFRGDPKKEDAARKALENMFKGKADTLAIHDPDDVGKGPGGRGIGGSGGGGGGRGGSGGGPGWSMPDWRGWFSGLGARFGDLGKALQAVLAFAAFLLAFTYLDRAWSIITGGLTIVFRWVLRLDARRGPVRKSHAPVAAPSHPALADPLLGTFERSVIAKYGPPVPAQASDEQL